MLRNALKGFLVKMRSDQRGVALAAAIMVVGTMVTLSAGFMTSTMTEMRSAQRYRDGTKALWLASSGIEEFLKNTADFDAISASTLEIGEYDIEITKDDSDPAQRVVQAIASVGEMRRGIQVTFPEKAPVLFDNTMTNGENFYILGLLTAIVVEGKTRIGGTYSKFGIKVSATFDDKQSGLDTPDTTMTYPDSDGNGTPDQFSDFKSFYEQEVAQYAPGEAVWLKREGTVWILPSEQLSKTKMIFVEATNEGGGDVVVLFDASWSPDQNLTIVSTGTVVFGEPLQQASTSKLNIISWEDYYEASLLTDSRHNGVTFSHGSATFGEAISKDSVTSGLIIANKNMNVLEFGVKKTFAYVDSRDADGHVPAGFTGLITPKPAGYCAVPDSWKEIEL